MKHPDDEAGAVAEAVDRQLRALVAEVRSSSPIHDLMAYHLGLEPGPGGSPGASRAKRVRPVLLLAVVETLGGDVEAALPAAAAVELLHNAALVFDDIQDRARLRRGRPALWCLCGTDQAMNVGVALQALAHLAAARGAPRDRAQALGEELGLCALRLAEGQWLDLRFAAGERPSIEGYMRMCGAKTASLVSSASYLGALLAPREDRTEPARRLGYHLGMQLQIEDDVAGIWGDGAAMGKEAGDIERRQKTLPLLYAFGVAGAPPEVAGLEALYYSDRPLRREDAAAIRRFAAELGWKAYAEDMARLHRDLALEALHEMADARDSPAEAVIRRLAGPVPAATSARA